MLKNKKLIPVLIGVLALIISISFIFSEKNKYSTHQIPTKLITVVHKDLPFKFNSEQRNIVLRPGEIKTINYSHPLFSKSSIKAQLKKSLINGKNNTFFSGAYWGYGFFF